MLVRPAIVVVVMFTEYLLPVFLALLFELPVGHLGLPTLILLLLLFLLVVVLVLMGMVMHMLGMRGLGVAVMVLLLHSTYGLYIIILLSLFNPIINGYLLSYG